MCAGVTCALSGCRHKVTAPQLPQILVPVELVEIPEPSLPLLEVPQIKAPPMPVAAAAAHPHRERRKPVVKAVITPSATAATEAETQQQEQAAAIGSLSTGGDTSPRAQQEAADLIASVDKRLNGLPPQTSDDQKAQMSKVRNFQKQAQDALSSGDVEGAKNLATKAKLLLDDMEKQ